MASKRKLSKLPKRALSSRGKSLAKKTLKSKGPSMDELLEKYGAKVRSLSRGDKVEGEVLEITSKRVIVDIGGKGEGLVAEKAYKEAESYIKTLKVGDKIEAAVIVSETPEGFTILSLRRAVQDATWEKLEKARRKRNPITVEGRSVNASGVMIDINGLAGFIPRSQLGKEVAGNPSSLVGKKFEAVVIDTNRGNNKVVLSEKEVSEAEELKFIREAIKKVKEGDVFDGVVTTIYDFGCFIRITTDNSKRKKKEKKPVGLEGLVHISELSWDKVNTPEDIVSVGDKVKVKVIGKTNGKLALSIKQAQMDPWEEVETKYKKDSKVTGKVVRHSDFGVFVSLEPGVEGLVHMTKIPPDKRLSSGDEIKVYVEEVDGKARKISLGLVLTTKPVGYK